MLLTLPVRLFLGTGFQALATYRIANVLWKQGGPANVGTALLLQSRSSVRGPACPEVQS